jgi:ComF family protein
MWNDAVRRPLRIALDSFAAVVLPSDCRVCGHPLVRLSRIPVCGDCLNTLSPSDVNACSICGDALEFTPTKPEATCGVCRRAHPRFDFAISFGSYDGALRRLVHLFKYEQLRPAANILGKKLAEAVASRNLVDEHPVLIVPVPLHKSKRRQRGFNQSESLARTALRHLDRSRFELHADNLRRVRPTVSQTGLTRHQRRENVRGAFKVTAPERVRDRWVLIADDVYTTGTTLNECARVLRAAGAKQVVVATVARVYRSATTMLPGEMFTQEENAAALAGAVAG